MAYNHAKELTEPWGCLSCGLSHSPEARQRRLKRLLPAGTRDIAAEFPCVYDLEKGSGKNKALYRDLATIGAKKVAFQVTGRPYIFWTI